MNQNLAKILREISVIIEIKGVEFKPQAYEKVAHSIEMLEEDVKDIYQKGGLKALEEISGVGRGIAEKIEEYIKNRRIKDHALLKKKKPVDIDKLYTIEEVGPKKILSL